MFTLRLNISMVWERENSTKRNVPQFRGCPKEKRHNRSKKTLCMDGLLPGHRSGV